MKHVTHCNSYRALNRSWCLKFPSFHAGQGACVLQWLRLCVQPADLSKSAGGFLIPVEVWFWEEKKKREKKQRGSSYHTPTVPTLRPSQAVNRPTAEGGECLHGKKFHWVGWSVCQRVRVANKRPSLLDSLENLARQMINLKLLRHQAYVTVL